MLLALYSGISERNFNYNYKHKLFLFWKKNFNEYFNMITLCELNNNCAIQVLCNYTYITFE